MLKIIVPECEELSNDAIKDQLLALGDLEITPNKKGDIVNDIIIVS